MEFSATYWYIYESIVTWIKSILLYDSSNSCTYHFCCTCTNVRFLPNQLSKLILHAPWSDTSSMQPSYHRHFWHQAVDILSFKNLWTNISLYTARILCLQLLVCLVVQAASQLWLSYSTQPFSLLIHNWDTHNGLRHHEIPWDIKDSILGSNRIPVAVTEKVMKLEWHEPKRDGLCQTIEQCLVQWKVKLKTCQLVLFGQTQSKNVSFHSVHKLKN